jgi:hypothetical protein
MFMILYLMLKFKSSEQLGLDLTAVESKQITLHVMTVHLIPYVNKSIWLVNGISMDQW